MSPPLTCSAVTKAYPGHGGDVPALRGVDLRVAAGEVVVVTGPSGSGKSTLLRLLAGLELPTDGRVWINGVETTTMTDAERTCHRRTSVGFVFQAYALLDDLTVADNVELPALLVGRTRRDAARRRRVLLERLELGDVGRARPSQLSGGQQQRVAIARALVNDPPLVLADEPTGNLDTATADATLRVLVGARAPTAAVVLVTHDPQVAAVGDRRLHLVDGRFP